MKKLVFDMGGVLIRYEPAYFLNRAGVTDPADRALLMSAVFASPEWAMMDEGLLDEAALEPIAFSKLPERLHGVAHRLIWEWFRPLEPIEGMAAFIRECKARGHAVYLLSNASRLQPDYWPDIPGSEYFDGVVVSALEKCVKPDPRIFGILLDRFNLKAGDCVFIDDMQKNVDGAEAVGMTGIRFTGDVDDLRQRINGLAAD